MTVNPGFGGQKYIPYCGEKVRELRKMITEKNLDVDIQVDGGVKGTIDRFRINWLGKLYKNKMSTQHLRRALHIFLFIPIRA